ncbi:hypothetical protein LIER_42300 [Lithospermum erythrorhizon]|uniref:Uncharacterized protein n=1 Tax=Lithospermum erythrorhizon TaxID=34254 RepID=A0AAV3RMI2_LITER
MNSNALYVLLLRYGLHYQSYRSTCIVKDACHGGYCFHLTAIYGRNNKLERRNLWKSLSDDQIVVHQTPWIVGGDFNVIRSVEEAKFGKLPDWAAIGEFNDCLRNVGFMDFPHEGCKFTWSRNWAEKSILKVLDRVICNREWLQEMRECTTYVCPAVVCIMI